MDSSEVIINWTIQAGNDLSDIHYFISRDSSRYAGDTIRNIRLQENN